MHRFLTASACLLATVQIVFGQADEPAKKKKPPKELPKKVEFELSIWESRLGLEDRQMRELRYAARAAVAKLKEASADEDAVADPWESLKVKTEPWVKIPLPRALKAASFTKVADAVLTKQQIASIASLKQHVRGHKKAAMRTARAHAKLAVLSQKLYLTEEQQTQLLKILKKRAEKRQVLVQKFKGKEDEMPEPTPVRQDKAFLDILDANQRKSLKKAPPEEEK